MVPQVITLSWDVPRTAMIAIMSCRETGTTEEYDTHGSGFGEDHFLRMEVGLLDDWSCRVSIAWVATDSTVATSTTFHLGIEYGRPELVFDGATHAGLSPSEATRAIDDMRVMQDAVDRFRSTRIAR